MKASGHIYAISKIFETILTSEGRAEEAEKFRAVYEGIKDRMGIIRRDNSGYAVYKIFLRRKIKEILGKDNEFVDAVFNNLHQIKDYFFSEEDFQKRCGELQTIGCLRNGTAEGIDFGPLTPETIRRESVKVHRALVEDYEKRLSDDQKLRSLISDDIREDSDEDSGDVDDLDTDEITHEHIE